MEDTDTCDDRDYTMTQEIPEDPAMTCKTHEGEQHNDDDMTCNVKSRIDSLARQDSNLSGNSKQSTTTGNMGGDSSSGTNIQIAQVSSTMPHNIQESPRIEDGERQQKGESRSTNDQEARLLGIDQGSDQDKKGQSQTVESHKPVNDGEPLEQEQDHEIVTFDLQQVLDFVYELDNDVPNGKVDARIKALINQESSHEARENPQKKQESSHNAQENSQKAQEISQKTKESSHNVPESSQKFRENSQKSPIRQIPDTTQGLPEDQDNSYILRKFIQSLDDIPDNWDDQETMKSTSGDDDLLSLEDYALMRSTSQINIAGGLIQGKFNEPQHNVSLQEYSGILPPELPSTISKCDGGEFQTIDKQDLKLVCVSSDNNDKHAHSHDSRVMPINSADPPTGSVTLPAFIRGTPQLPAHLLPRSPDDNALNGGYWSHQTPMNASQQHRNWIQHYPPGQYQHQFQPVAFPRQFHDTFPQQPYYSDKHIRPNTSHLTPHNLPTTSTPTLGSQTVSTETPVSPDFSQRSVRRKYTRRNYRYEPNAPASFAHLAPRPCPSQPHYFNVKPHVNPRFLISAPYPGLQKPLVVVPRSVQQGYVPVMTERGLCYMAADTGPGQRHDCIPLYH